MIGGARNDTGSKRCKGGIHERVPPTQQRQAKCLCQTVEERKPRKGCILHGQALGEESPSNVTASLMRNEVLT